MGGHKKIWYMYAFTSLALKVNMVETLPVSIGTCKVSNW